MKHKERTALLKEYYSYVKPILQSAEFKRRRSFEHHQDSVYNHSLRVSLKAFKFAHQLEKMGISISKKNVAIAGLLHDFYTRPWREKSLDPRFFKKHGFSHAADACHNAYLYFPELMNDRIEDAILRHMFPLNIKPPKYLESWMITLSDKIVSFEVFLHPSELPRYVGISKETMQKLNVRRWYHKAKELLHEI